MLTFAGSLVFILWAYVYVFPIGYVLLHLKQIPQFNSVPFIIRIPAYLTMGFAALSLVLGIVGRIILNGTIAWLYFMSSWALMFVLIFRTSYPRVVKNKKRVELKQLIHNVVSLTLFCTIIFYFSTAVNQLKWPFPGDATATGMTVSLIRYQQKIPSTYDPISDIRLIYPTGFHAVSTLLSFFMQYGYYPGEVVMLTAALITTLIPCLVFFVTYMKTRTISFSLLPFLSIFLLHPSGNRELSILGLFVNGTYPSLMGILLMIAFIFLIHLRDSSKDALDLDPVHFPILVFIIVGSIFFVYSHFLVFILIYLLVFLISNKKLVTQRVSQIRPTIKVVLRSRYAPIIVLLTISAIIFIVLFGLKVILHLISTFQYYISLIGLEFQEFYLFKTFMYDNLNGFMILLMVPVAVISLIMKGLREDQTNLFYLCFFVPIILSLKNDLFKQFFLFFLPRRSVILLAILAWVIFARSLHIISSRHLRFITVSKKVLGFQNFSALCITIVLFLLLFSKLIPRIMFNLHEGFIITGRREFWSISPCEGRGTESINCNHPADYEYHPDYLAAVWIDQNIPVEDLILNDLSWASFYLQSFSIKNAVFSIVPENLRRAKECRVIWDQPDHPKHEQILISLIEKYGIKYLWVTAEPKYFDWWELGGDDMYKSKKKSPSVYGVIFDQYPFLIPIFQIGDSKIYKIALES